MFSGNNFRSFTSVISDNDNILFSIVTGNLNKVKQYITKDNVNKIIDSTNSYTPLHHAITQPNEEIVKYLLTIGANPKLKQKEGKDCFDLAMSCHRRYIFDYDKQKNENKIDELHIKIDTINNKIYKLEDDNKFLNKSVDDYITKIGKITTELTEKKVECIKLKRSLDESELAFSNLLKKKQKF